MKELKIEYKGGYNQVSKYLTREHDASFAVIVDALVNIYNMNIDNLVKIGGENSVEISNGFLSRNTGLSLDIIKRNVEKIEKIGLVTAIKKGKGNTRRYVIHIGQINTYIKALKGKFDQWYKESLESSKKDMARSKKADQIKIEASIEKFEKAMEIISTPARKSPIKLVENPPTKTIKTHQPKRAKPPVVDIKEKTTIKTTTNKSNVVVDEIFNKENTNGAYVHIKKYDKTVYRKSYEEYTANKTKEGLDQLLTETEQQISEDESSINLDILNDEFKDPIEVTPTISNDRIMMYVYDLTKKLEVKKERQAKREYETTKKPASLETSAANWGRLKKAYQELPAIVNQGKFYVSKKDKTNFNALSEFRQEWVIKSVEAMRNNSTTASRPSNYIEEAMADNLKKVEQRNSNQLIGM